MITRSEVVEPRTSGELRHRVVVAICDQVNVELSVKVGDSERQIRFDIKAVRTPDDGSIKVIGEQTDGSTVNLAVSANRTEPASLTLVVS